MQIQSMHFQRQAGRAARDPELKKRMAKLGFAQRRAERVDEYGPAQFEALRDSAEIIRERSLGNLAGWIEQFEREATRRGATVLYARNSREVGDRIIEICRAHGVKKAIKSKSMLSEEAGLNAVLEAAGVRPVETDLGEYICQLANEPPSHIIAPAIHKSKEDVTDLFVAHHGRPAQTEIGRAHV